MLTTSDSEPLYEIVLKKVNYFVMTSGTEADQMVVKLCGHSESAMGSPVHSNLV